MIPFEEIDEKEITCCRLTEGATEEETFKSIFSKLKSFEFKPNYEGDLEFNFEFISQSCKKHVQDKEVYLLKMVYDPLLGKILEDKTDHLTCPDYNINRLRDSDCWHMRFARRIIELYK